MADEVPQKHNRLLFVANQACGNPALCAEVRARAADGANVLVVAPVLGSPQHHWIADDAESRVLAEKRLDESLRCLRKHGLRAHGTLGDEDPLLAIEDALYGFPAEEIIICLEEPERAHGFHKGVAERARKRFDRPVIEIIVQSRQLAAATPDQLVT